MYFLVLKIVLSLLLIVCGFYRIQRTKEIWVWTFPVWGILDLTTMILDDFFFTSNLELFSIYFLLLTIPLLFLYSKIGNISPLKLSPFVIFPFFLILVFKLNLITTNQNLHSKYGFLNVKEYMMAVSVCCVLHIVYIFSIVLSIVKQNAVELYKLMVLFGLGIYFVGNLFYNLIEFRFIEDIKGSLQLTRYYLPIQLFVSKGLLILGLIWKE